MGNFSNGEKPTVWGTSHIKKSYIMGKSKKVKHKIFLQYGEILEKEYAAVNTITTMLWGIPQNVFTTHISVHHVSIGRAFPKKNFS